MAAVGLFAGVFSLLIYLCIILVPVALLVVLQVWLCKKSIRLGLILPGVSLVMSLILAFGVIAFSSLSTAGASGELVLEQNGQVVERTVTEMVQLPSMMEKEILRISIQIQTMRTIEPKVSRFL